MTDTETEAVPVPVPVPKPRDGTGEKPRDDESFLAGVRAAAMAVHTLRPSEWVNGESDPLHVVKLRIWAEMRDAITALLS